MIKREANIDIFWFRENLLLIAEFIT